MESILTYLRRLAPTFKKHEVFDAIDAARQNLRENVIPAWEIADTSLPKKFANKAVQDKVKAYEKALGAARGGIGADVTARLKNSQLLLDKIEESAKRVFGETEASAGLNYQKATYLRLIAAIEFAATYSLDWLNWICVLEQSEQKGQDVNINEQIPPGLQERANAQWPDWLIAMEIVAMGDRQVAKNIEELPDAVVSQLTESTLGATLGVKRLDPFGMRNFSANWNPFYIFGLMFVENKIQTYKANKAKLELLQLRLMNLRKLAEGNPDAQLQKEIEYTANRVVKLQVRIARVEQEYAS